jgi:hypothetical protein
MKLAVRRRDVDRGVVCSATNESPFDYDLPYSKGGTSITKRLPDGVRGAAEPLRWLDHDPEECG